MVLRNATGCLLGDLMKFLQPAHAPEGLNSYARVSRMRPGLTALNILEGLFGLIGVVVIVLFIRFGSFEKAGEAVDTFFHGVKGAVTAATAHHK